MYSPPDGYLEKARASTRQMDLYLAIGANIDQTSADDITAITGDFLPLSNTDQAVDAIYEIHEGMATFEAYGIKTASDAGMVAPPMASKDYPPEVGFWSSPISDGDGMIDWTFTITLSQAHTSALTLFTRQVGITAGTATFIDGDTQETVAFVPQTDSAVISSAYTYSEIIVHITQITEAYSHLRIAEIEFGASITLSKTTLTDEIHIVEEYDPLMSSIPLCELDFTLLNVLGEWDSDNPLGGFHNLTLGTPITASVSLQDGPTMLTIPLGRFIMDSKQGDDTTLTLTCYDPRVALSSSTQPFTLGTGSSIGAQLTDLLTDLHIPHVVDDKVMAITPTTACTWPDDTTLLEVALNIEQAYDVWMVPGRDGFIHVQVGPPSGSYGNFDKEMEYSWPLPSTFTKYNYIQIAYGSGNTKTTYAKDLRTNASEVKTALNIDNPLITTEAQAQALATKIQAKLYSEMVEVEWRADALNDLGDSIGMFGKWGSDAIVYKEVYQDLTYDGGLTARTKGVK